MKTCPTLQRFIIDLGERHGFDLDAPEAHLRLEHPPYMPLVVEKIGPYRLSIAHYQPRASVFDDPQADPDLELFTGYATWVPVAITQPEAVLLGRLIGGFRCYATTTPDGTTIDRFNPRGQADLARFAATWACNLRQQGWLTGARKVA
jgi:hypothetical protein